MFGLLMMSLLAVQCEPADDGTGDGGGAGANPGGDTPAPGGDGDGDDDDDEDDDDITDPDEDDDDDDDIVDPDGDDDDDDDDEELNNLRARLAALEEEKKQRKRKKMSEVERLKLELAEAKNELAASRETSKKAKMMAELRRLAVANNLKNPDLYLRLVDTSGMDVNEKGKVTGAKDALRALKKSDPSLFRAAPPVEPDDVDEDDDDDDNLEEDLTPGRRGKKSDRLKSKGKKPKTDFDVGKQVAKAIRERKKRRRI